MSVFHVENTFGFSSVYFTDPAQQHAHIKTRPVPHHTFNGLLHRTGVGARECESNAQEIGSGDEVHRQLRMIIMRIERE